MIHSRVKRPLEGHDRGRGGQECGRGKTEEERSPNTTGKLDVFFERQRNGGDRGSLGTDGDGGPIEIEGQGGSIGTEREGGKIGTEGPGGSIGIDGDGGSIGIDGDGE